MDRSTTMSKVHLKESWGRAMTAWSGLFRTLWRHLLLRSPQAKKRWRLAWVTLGLLACPLAAAPEPSVRVIEDILAARLKSAGASAVCLYPDVDSEWRTRAWLNGHDFWVHRATVNREPIEQAKVRGQISHILNLWGVGRPDDQIYYTIPIKDGVPQLPEIVIEHGGLASLVKYVSAPYEIFSIKKLKFNVPGLGEVEAELHPDKLDEVWRDLATKAEGKGWEDQAAALITAIGVAAANPDYCNHIHWTGDTTDGEDAIESRDLQGVLHGTTGFACYGRYCDNVSLAYKPVPAGLDDSSTHWSGHFSEEGAKKNWKQTGQYGRNVHVCEEGLVTGIHCTGDYCDNIALRCTQPVVGQLTDCRWSESMSEEDGTFRFSNFIAGVGCEGRYCDNMSFYVCALNQDDTLLKEASNPAVYVVYGGAKFHIPSEEEFIALGFAWGSIQVVPDGTLASVPIVARDRTLLKERSNPAVYVMYGGSKRYIPSEKRFEELGFTWDDIRVVPDGALASIPEGPDA